MEGWGQDGRGGGKIDDNMCVVGSVALSLTYNRWHCRKQIWGRVMALDVEQDPFSLFVGVRKHQLTYAMLGHLLTPLP